MRDFIKNKPFKILQCDKNIGFLLISNEDFLKLAYSHLFSSKYTYIQLSEDPLIIK